MGSPIGATFCTRTTVFGISPISKSLRRTSSSGANKANIEFGDANIAFIMDLLQADRLQELKVIDPTKTKETRTQQSKEERE